jgi:hypothetical protein
MPIQNIRPNVIRIAGRVLAADRHVNPNEVKMITLMRLNMMTAPESKAASGEREN